MCRCSVTCCRESSPRCKPPSHRRPTSRVWPAERYAATGRATWVNSRNGHCRDECAALAGRSFQNEQRKKFTMIEIPPLQFPQTNGIRMGYYEAGPKTDTPPMVLCHGWPELAFSWRHQIKALSEAGIRVIAPDQRGYGASDRPEPVEDYDLEHLTGDLVGLLDHLKIDKAIFVGHDWGGFVVWQMAMRHPGRVAGVVGVNTPHFPRAPIDPIELFRQRFGDQMYIVQFQHPDRAPDKIFGSRVEQTFDAFMRKPLPRKPEAAAEPAVSGVGASSKTNLSFPQMIAAYDAKFDHRTPILSA